MRLVALVLLFTLVSAVSLSAQDTYQARYGTAKALLAEGQYGLAMEAFREVAQAETANRYVAYASFYYGLAAILDGQGDLAEVMWQQTQSKYPDWDEQQELDFWLGARAFSTGKFQEGYRRLDKLKRGEEKDALTVVKNYYVNQEQDVHTLHRLFEQYSQDRVLAKHLADRIAAQPLVQQNQDLLDFLINDFDLDPAQYNRITKEQTVFKDSYRVAVMLPFLHDLLARRRPNQIPEFYQGLLEMWEGMRMAAETLDSLGMPIELVAYDTKRDSATTARLLATPELLSADLIIGPLFPEPVDLVRQFSEENRIVMFNPMSTNSEVVGTNPFAFLIAPSNETRARRVADYMTAHDTDSVAYIFFGTRQQDSAYAFAYQAELLARGFEVPVVMQVDEEESQAGFEFLTETMSFNRLKRLDSVRAAAELEEFNQRKRRNSSLRLEKEEFFVIPKDSIGHVLVASDNGLIAASMVGAIQTRFAKGDSIPLIGSEEWLLQEYDYVAYEQLERLGVMLTAPTYFEKNTARAEAFQESYIRRQKSLPGREVYVGYDMLMFLGEMLHRHGTYFQFGMREQGQIEGIFL